MKRPHRMKKPMNRSHLKLQNVDIFTPEGRPLFRDLNMTLEGEKVAVIGRNGGGKSTLLQIMNGSLQPRAGAVVCNSRPYLVPQQISFNGEELFRLLSCSSITQAVDKELMKLGLKSLTDLKGSAYLSNGEIRKIYLLYAKLTQPEILLLDEPTEDLDEAGVEWLIHWVKSWPDNLVVVSHDRALLTHFHNFFIISESGCSSFSGSFNELKKKMENDEEESERRYLGQLEILARKEEQRAKVARRRRRKKNFGRISELDRCTPKQRLNKKRSKAQVSQGKVAKISKNRIVAIRDWVQLSRRALSVKLPLQLVVPEVEISLGEELVRLDSVSAGFDGRDLFRNVNLSLGNERLAVLGKNGTGKTTLLNIILGNIKPLSGKVTISGQLGWIGQGGANWMLEESLVSLLWRRSEFEELEDVAQLLLMHAFPLALASRPLSTLSPGERVRAALICLFQQRPGIQVLVLDEPTYGLDFLAEESLARVLKAWPGALIVSSHNRNFLASIGLLRKIVLEGNGNHLEQTN